MKVCLPVHIRWSHHSLARVWTEGYQEYVHAADVPRLLIRLEDLLFHTEAVLHEIKTFVGARASMIHSLFTNWLQPSNTPILNATKKQSGFVAALVKYGRDHGEHTGNMTVEDRDYAQRFLSRELLELFQYRDPQCVFHIGWWDQTLRRTNCKSTRQRLLRYRLNYRCDLRT